VCGLCVNLATATAMCCKMRGVHNIPVMDECGRVSSTTERVVELTVFFCRIAVFSASDLRGCTGGGPNGADDGLSTRPPSTAAASGSWDMVEEVGRCFLKKDSPISVHSPGMKVSAVYS
jgi:hypothetical protein